MKKITPEELISFGLHFGHKAHRLHPSFRKYIHKNEKGITIIDLFKTVPLLEAARELAYNFGKNGKTLLVVGTKKQAKLIVSTLCKDNNIPQLTAKWVGGFISNHEEIYKNIKKMADMKSERDNGEWDKFPKHEQVKKNKKLARIAALYDGVAGLTQLPDALFIIDIKREQNAVLEAKKASINIIAITDSNTDPNLVDYPIPANDDAISSIQFITGVIITAYVEGREQKESSKSKDQMLNQAVSSAG